MFKTVLIVCAGLFLFGCGPAKYSGPSGASFSDFAKTRTDCLARLQGYGSSGYINQYGGSYSSGPKVSCGAFTGCLAASGYTQSPNGRFDSKGISVNCQ